MFTGASLNCRTKGEYRKSGGRELAFVPPSYSVEGAGKSPLQLALLSGSLATVRVLLDHGADPNEHFKVDRHFDSIWRPAEWVDDLKVTPVQEGETWHLLKVPRTPMSEARDRLGKYTGDWEAIVALLRERGAVEVDVNTYDDGTSVGPKAAAAAPAANMSKEAIDLEEKMAQIKDGTWQKKWEKKKQEDAAASASI